MYYYYYHNNGNIISGKSQGIVSSELVLAWMDRGLLVQFNHVVVQGKCQGLLFSDYVSIARVTSSCISALPFVAVGAVDDDIAIRSWFSLSVAGGVVV